MSKVQDSFQFLHDSVPQWLLDIARVQEKVTAMQDELTRIPLSISQFAKHKTDSTASIRHERLAAIVEQDTRLHDAQTDPVANRKRKTLSIHSGHASGPSRYRPRTMVVMSYDGDMQKSFELLVRAIGTARNMLRKAKMEAKMNELATLAGSSEDDIDAAEDDDEDAIVAKISYRPRMASMRARTAARRNGQPGATAAFDTPTALFDSTDKLLEQSQEQCEKAAHLTLRDGDCRKELQNVRNNLENVLDTARSQVSRRTVTTPHGLPEAQSHDTSDTSVSSIEPLYKRHFPPTSMRQSVSCQGESVQSTAPTSMVPSQTKTIDIEVDDADDDEDDFVMPPVRLTSRLGVRA